MFITYWISYDPIKQFFCCWKRQVQRIYIALSQGFVLNYHEQQWRENPYKVRKKVQENLREQQYLAIQSAPVLASQYMYKVDTMKLWDYWFDI